MSRIWCECMCHHLWEYVGDECWCDCNIRGSEMNEREKYVEQLRELADFYESVPDNFPLPLLGFNRYIEKGELPLVLDFCKPLTKSVWGNSIKLTKTLDFGSISFLISQSEVCERKVVGQTWIEARPAVEGCFQDQVEWECKPILSKIADGDTGER